jgi:hypothetical protein
VSPSLAPAESRQTTPTKKHPIKNIPIRIAASLESKPIIIVLRFAPGRLIGCEAKKMEEDTAGLERHLSSYLGP